MIVKVIKNFGDKTTGATYSEQVKRTIGDIFECEDELARERIEKGFVESATEEEAKIYADSIDTMDDESKDLETDKPKSFEECTIDELIEIANEEKIELSYPKDETSKQVIIETIEKVREERKNKENEKNDKSKSKKGDK